MAKRRGEDVLLYVDVGSSVEDMQLVGGQRGVTFSESTTMINVSDKETGAVEDVLPGRGAYTISLDGVIVISDAALQELKDASRNRTKVKVERFDDGVAVEECDGFITSRVEGAPDQEAATYTVEIQQTTQWQASS